MMSNSSDLGDENAPPPKRSKGGQDCSSLVCIVHVPGLQYGPLLQLSANEDGYQKLDKLKEIRDKRLAQHAGSVHQMKDTCNLIPDVIKEHHHGYHRVCYQRFTMNINRLATHSDSREPSRSRPSRRSSADHMLFAPDCIFCNSEGRKKVKSKGAWTTEGMSSFISDGWQTILEIAEKTNDEKLLTRIRCQDLFACEAKFHKSCRTKYLQKPDKWRSTNVQNKDKQVQLTEAHNHAFHDVCEVIDTDVLRDKKMVKLTDLVKTYIASLELTEFANPNFRGENFKIKLEKHEEYKDRLAFCKLYSSAKMQSYIVYSSDIDVNNAVRLAYELASTDMIQEAGTYLRRVIFDSFAMSNELKWPPTAQDLGDVKDIVPSQLEKFLSYVIGGKATTRTSKSHRLVYSIGQDICRAATNGEWKLPKHMLICMTLRHLFRSERLITLLNRMGHSENYSFSLELETALAQAVDETSNLLSTQIIRSPVAPSVFHSEFDNFDQLLNNLTGMGSIHTAHGIMLQDIEGRPEDHGGTRVEIPSIPRNMTTKQRSLNIQSSECLPDCYVTQRRSPQITIEQRTYPGGEDAQHKARINHFLWMLIRQQNCMSQQVPGWTGFISMTGQRPETLTTIDYYPVIASPITDYKTVQECLRYAEEATNEVKQRYTITTFDLGVCMKAYPLVWNNQVRYEKHIILIGTFHLICAYMKMIGKKMNGSGLSDILLEAGLIVSGSIEGVLSGKHYDRAMNCHKVMLECLERLLLSQYLASHNEADVFASLTEQSKKVLYDITHTPSEETMNTALADEELKRYIEGFMQYRDDSKTGNLGTTAQLWVSYMDHVWLVLTLTHAVKHNDFLLYAHCLHLMSDLFFSFGGQNYARYLTFFSLFIANIEISHPGATELMKRGAISVARSFIPGNRCAIDKTMEETFMRHAKSHGSAGGSGAGVSGVLTNHDAYQRWVRTTHARSQYVNTTLSMADMLSGSTEGIKHRDLRPAEVLKSEKLVCRTMEAVESFLNPFTVDSPDQLLILSSGAAASLAVQKDVLRAEQAGREAKEVFIASRLETGKDFFEPVKRMNLMTLGDMSKKSKVKTTTNRVVQYKQQGNVAFQLLMKSQSQGVQLDLKELMTYLLTPVPYSIGTADVFLAKTDKSKALHHLTKGHEDAAVPQSSETLVIHDGNAVFYYMKETPGNFSQICSKVFDIMPPIGDVVFSTDSYMPNSVKAMERLRRGCGEKLIIKGENTNKPSDWKLFLGNDVNKQQFIALLTRLWSQDAYAKKLQGRQVTVICEGTAYLLTSDDGLSTHRREIPMLKSTQEESDSRIILYCKHGSSQSYKYLRVKSPDTDVFFILLHYAPTLGDVTILFDTGTGNKKRLLNVSDMSRGYTQQHCTALMALHAYSGCDSTSAFKGLGKVKPLKKLLQMPKFVPVLARLGDSWHVPTELVDDLDEFTCAIYERPRMRRVDEARFLKMSQLCDTDNDTSIKTSHNIDMANLPPCRKSLEQHIRRVNYQVGIWKRAHITDPDIPLATDGHGWTMVDGKMEPLWYDGDVLPQQLIDIVEGSPTDDEDESDDDGPLPAGTDYLAGDSSDSDSD